MTRPSRAATPLWARAGAARRRPARRAASKSTPGCMDRAATSPGPRCRRPVQSPLAAQAREPGGGITRAAHSQPLSEHARLGEIAQLDGAQRCGIEHAGLLHARAALEVGASSRVSIHKRKTSPLGREGTRARAAIMAWSIRMTRAGTGRASVTPSVADQRRHRAITGTHVHAEEPLARTRSPGREQQWKKRKWENGEMKEPEARATPNQGDTRSYDVHPPQTFIRPVPQAPWKPPLPL